MIPPPLESGYTPIQDYQWPRISQATVDRVVYWLKNYSLSEYEEEDGPLKNFEERFARYHQVNHALLKSSGTSALFSAYHAIGIRPGDIVFIPAFTFVATASPLLFLGAKIVMIDCDEQGNISPGDLEKKLKQFPGVKCVVVTHNGGVPAEMERILELKKQYPYKLIEDCARSPGSEYKGMKVGTFGDIGCFSFQEKKAISGGEGGMVITNDRSLYERMVLIGHYFRSKSTMHIQEEDLQVFAETGLGMNFSIHPITVALAMESFENLDFLLEKRLQAWKFFTGYLEEQKIRGLIPQKIPQSCTRNGFYHFIFRFNADYFGEGMDRTSYVSGLRNLGVDVRITDNKPLYQFPLFQRAGLDYFRIQGSDVLGAGEFRADSYYEGMITIPPITDLSILERYGNAIRDFEGKYLLSD